MHRLIRTATGSTAATAIADPIELAQWVRSQYGDLHGFRMQGQQMLVYRWDREGNPHLVDRYELELVCPTN